MNEALRQSYFITGGVDQNGSPRGNVDLRERYFSQLSIDPVIMEEVPKTLAFVRHVMESPASAA